MKVERTRDGSRLQRIPVLDRKCGDCRLCCKLLAVGKDERPDDFKKPQGVWCEHCFDGGCKIYSRRPKDCEEYECTWHRGIFDDDDRPDRSKVVVSLEYGEAVLDSDGRELYGPTPVWCVYESIPGVTLKKNSKAARIVAELDTLVVEDTPGNFTGPFPVCIIPSRSHTRTVKFPNAKYWVPLLRPGDIDPKRTPPHRTRR